MSRRLAAAALLAAICCGPARAASTIAVTTGTTTSMGVLSGLSDPTLDGRDGIVFLGTSSALFAASSPLARILAAGDPFPDGGVVASMGLPAMAPGGCMAVHAAGLNADGVLQRCGGAFSWLVRRSDRAPDGHFFTVFGPTVGVGPGQAVAFTARRDDGLVGLYRVSSGVMTEIARTGLPAPRGGTFADFRPIGVAQDGLVGFRGLVEIGPDGLFVGDGTILAPVVLVNDPAPVVGGLFAQVGEATFNASGRWAFRARLSGDGPTGVFTAESSGVSPTIEPLALEGDTTPIGGTYAQFASSLVPSIDTAGHVAFRVGVSDGSAGAGVFIAQRNAAAAVVLVAGQDTVVGPLLEPGNPLLADDGSLLVPGTLKGNRAGFFSVRDGVVLPIAMFGDTTDIGDNIRFLGAALRDDLAGAVLLGQREGIFRSTGAGLETLATLGDRSPVGGVFARFDVPVAGPNDTTIVDAEVRGGRSSEVLLATGHGAQRSVAAAGRRAPGGGRFLAFSTGGIDVLVRPARARSATAFQSRLSGSPAPSGLFIRPDGGHLRAVALANHRAPGGGSFTAFGSPAVDDAGHVAFLARLTGAAGGTGLFEGGKGHVKRVTLVGTPTGTRLSGTYTVLESPLAGRLGLLFRGVLNRQGSQGIFLHRGKRTEAVVASGDPTPDGGAFLSVDSPALAAHGLAFLGRESGGGVTGGLYRVSSIPSSGNAAGSVERLAALGGTTPIGGTYLGFGRPSGNAGGSIAVATTIEGGAAAGAVVRLDP